MSKILNYYQKRSRLKLIGYSAASFTANQEDHFESLWVVFWVVSGSPLDSQKSNNAFFRELYRYLKNRQFAEIELRFVTLQFLKLFNLIQIFSRFHIVDGIRNFPF
ncbi:hypothetical protein [Parapedobacter tibetensis]|uniref:hypothetical protein n=1 Tax=Parapedobacter tibetensis TaxID=2972951 RepID=UPI00214D2443|nr:hypothetical protein [Parapedobacter tibetensis]